MVKDSLNHLLLVIVVSVDFSSLIFLLIKPSMTLNPNQINVILNYLTKKNYIKKTVLENLEHSYTVLKVVE